MAPCVYGPCIGRDSGYFHFILLSTAVRSFEAGVVASMMPSIRQGLQLSYTSQGNVAGSPDYGIVPSGLLAMAIFKRFSPFVVLTSGYFIISAVSVCCALLPSLPTLVAARAIGGLCWGLAAVHYPTWVNRYGPAEQRTLWMAGINAMLLTGIVSGYVLGGLARATGAARWESLYLLEALLMFSCALLGSRFEPSVVQVEPAPASKAEKSDVTGERSFFPKELVALGRSGLFLSTLAAGCFQSGAVGFMLYFITQALAAIFHWSPRIIYICVSLVITVGPIGGIVLGAAYLNRAGGYQNYRRAHQMSVSWAHKALETFIAPIPAGHLHRICDPFAKRSRPVWFVNRSWTPRSSERARRVLPPLPKGPESRPPQVLPPEIRTEAGAGAAAEAPGGWRAREKVQLTDWKGTTNAADGAAISSSNQAEDFAIHLQSGHQIAALLRDPFGLARGSDSCRFALAFGFRFGCEGVACTFFRSCDCMKR
eukprot:g26938.t1